MRDSAGGSTEMWRTLPLSSLGVLLLCVSQACALLSCSPRGDAFHRVNTPGGLHVRADPDRSSRSLALMPFGQAVTTRDDRPDAPPLEGTPGKWLRVKYTVINEHQPEHVIGYAYSAYLSEVDLSGEWVPGRFYSGGDPFTDADLNFFSDGTFRMTVNLCEGFGVLSGTYTRKADVLFLKESSRNFPGWGHEDRNEFRFKILDSQRLLATGEMFFCTLYDGTELERISYATDLPG